MTTLALFDLDHTLIPIDSDYEWGRFLVRTGAVNAATFEARNAHYYEQYTLGTLNAVEYLGFALHTLAQFMPQQLAAMQTQFVKEVVQPAIRPAALDLLKWHREQGHCIAIVTATNRFVTTPIAHALGVSDLLAATGKTDENGRYTGEIDGSPSQGAGKIVHVQNWLDAQGKRLSDFGVSYFYSDSHNDLPLLELVTHPVATNPNDKLRQHAKTHDWRILELFDKQ